MSTVKVHLGTRSYPIHVLPGGLTRLGSLCRKQFESRRVALVSAPRIYRHHGQAAVRSLSRAGFSVTTLITRDGEQAKTQSCVSGLHDKLARAHFERQDPVVVLAGGTLGDAAGFAAATYLRGVPLAQVPTTLLAQVDSAIGGKTGINLPLGKNLVGSIWQPALVLCDPRVLSTLPAREFRSGLAEVVKYGCIAYPNLVSRLEKWVGSGRTLPETELTSWIEVGVRTKSKVVSMDEHEHDFRRVLNFGHTFGHALENATGYGRLLHGEAVALGLCVALVLSEGHCGLDPRFRERVVKLLRRCFPRLGFPNVTWSQLQAAMASDKKTRQGRQVWVLLTQPGQSVLDTPTTRQIRTSITVAQKLWAQSRG